MINLFTPRQVHTVGQLLGQVKKLNEQQFKLIWVEGEIKNFTRAGSGHLYFSLSDGQASLRVVMFRSQAAFLRFTPQEGQKILCRGQVSVYSPRGELQFIADSLEPMGTGAEAIALAQLKQRLAAEGLFEHKRKLPLPARRVLLLTSLQGAAVHDFIKVMRRGQHGIEIKIWPIQVQGAGALPGILPVFKRLHSWNWPEVVVITRGGGASQDLQIFNQEELVRAVAACPIPVLSAVGHEIDVTLCDLAADARAATPTAAAEMLLQPWEELQRRFHLLAGRLRQAAIYMVNARQMRLDHLKARIRRPVQHLQWQRARLARLQNSLPNAWRLQCDRQKTRLHYLRLKIAGHNPQARLARQKERLAGLKQKSLALMAAKLAARANQWQNRHEKLAALNPLAVLTRGYALAQTETGRIIRASSQVQPGQHINIRLAQGALLAEVKDIIE